jgi:hypothetical protein
MSANLHFPNPEMTTPVMFTDVSLARGCRVIYIELG